MIYKNSATQNEYKSGLLNSCEQITIFVEKDGKFEKDKSSERKDSILPEEATHFGDAVDKRFWTKYGNILYKAGGSTFVSPRI